MAQRRDDYIDRRTDGYSEPLEVYVLGTSHVSEASAADVRRVVDAVQPQSVVVEVRFASQQILYAKSITAVRRLFIILVTLAFFLSKNAHAKSTIPAVRRLFIILVTLACFLSKNAHAKSTMGRG